jgi:hypothetical protein
MLLDELERFLLNRFCEIFYGAKSLHSQILKGKTYYLTRRTWTRFQTQSSGLGNAVESYVVLTLRWCRSMTNKTDVVKHSTIASVSMRFVTLIRETPSCYWRIRSCTPRTGNTLLCHPPYNTAQVWFARQLTNKDQTYWIRGYPLNPVLDWLGSWPTVYE